MTKRSGERRLGFLERGLGFLERGLSFLERGLGFLERGLGFRETKPRRFLRRSNERSGCTVIEGSYCGGCFCSGRVNAVGC